MDEFVRNTLTEWGFASLIERFEDEEIDKEALLSLGDKEIDLFFPKAGPRAKFTRRLEKLKRLLCVSEENSGPVLPSSSAACENKQHGIKRNLDLQQETDGPAKMKRQADPVLTELQSIMEGVHDRLSDLNTDSKLNAFLRKRIGDLREDKKELVGVFGKTGAGKSSLINAVVGERDLLPAGELTACTTVMIRVEANTQNKYEGEIEFMSLEEWKDELWSVTNLFGDISDEEKKTDKDYKDIVERMTALYGDEWKGKSPDCLMEPKYFKEIPEFLKSERKIVKAESAKKLKVKILKYTRSELDVENNPRWFWPLVKCVTVKVPNNDLLKHMTIVDLPGNGDRNKSRDQMWKTVVASCSTVWIVSEMNRALADRDAWDILERTCDLMGNGGECQNIYFICTKSDHLDVNDSSEDIDRNSSRNLLKAKVRKEFNKLDEVKKHFTDDCFEVFTVSSTEFLRPTYLHRDETEIPKLRERLQSLNEQHDQTLNYVSGAYGILSLIQGANGTNVESDQIAQVQDKLKGILDQELQKVHMSMKDVFEVFERCLSAGVEKSKAVCKDALKRKLYPRGGASGFHRQLRCALKNQGIHKMKNKEINLNKAISHCLTDSIDEEFRKMFPNDAKHGSVYETIHAFSLDTTRLVPQYKQMELQLIFLKTEEATVKTELCKDVRQRKKFIYSGLTDTVMEIMQEYYEKAAEITGLGTLNKMRDIVEKRLSDVHNTIFDEAKDVLLYRLKDLTETVLKNLRDSLVKAMELSFSTDDRSIPDCGKEFHLVKKRYDEMMGQNEEDVTGADLMD